MQPSKRIRVAELNEEERAERRRATLINRQLKRPISGHQFTRPMEMRILAIPRTESSALSLLKTYASSMWLDYLNSNNGLENKNMTWTKEYSILPLSVGHWTWAVNRNDQMTNLAHAWMILGEDVKQVDKLISIIREFKESHLDMMPPDPRRRVPISNLSLQHRWREPLFHGILIEVEPEMVEDKNESETAVRNVATCILSVMDKAPLSFLDFGKSFDYFTQELEWIWDRVSKWEPNELEDALDDAEDLEGALSAAARRVAEEALQKVDEVIDIQDNRVRERQKTELQNQATTLRVRCRNSHSEFTTRTKLHNEDTWSAEEMKLAGYTSNVIRFYEHTRQPTAIWTAQDLIDTEIASIMMNKRVLHAILLHLIRNSAGKWMDQNVWFYSLEPVADQKARQALEAAYGGEAKQQSKLWIRESPVGHANNIAPLLMQRHPEKIRQDVDRLGKVVHERGGDIRVLRVVESFMGAYDTQNVLMDRYARLKKQQ